LVEVLFDSKKPERKQRESGTLDAIEAIPVAAASGSETRDQCRAAALARSFLPFGAQNFHLRFEPAHPWATPLYFLVVPLTVRLTRLDRPAPEVSRKRAAQHLFAAAGRVSFPKIKQDDVEQGFELKRALDESTAPIPRDVVGIRRVKEAVIALTLRTIAEIREKAD